MPQLEAIESLEVAVYRVPTNEPESDGTAEWDHTDVVVVQVGGGGRKGMGWSYASAAAARMIDDTLRQAVVGQSPLAIEAVWETMYRRLRNIGAGGAGSMAVSAVDTALWDLKAKILGVALVDLFGAVRDAAPTYGSGGFTSYTDQRLCDQLAGWAAEGVPRVKMKVGREPSADSQRVALARRAIGDGVELFVDANGAYSRKHALAMAEVFHHESRVAWFEEPCSSDDLEGLRLLRDRAPPGMDIAAGEYGDRSFYFRRMLDAGAVDCLQADATRCGGYTGFLKVAALCAAFEMPLSAHCAPQLHAHVGCAVPCLRHIEYFHDHVRVARLLFSGALEPTGGTLHPDRQRSGHGIELKAADAKRYEL